MSKIKWYKRDPVAWLHGTRQLTLEERGAYADLIELIMSHDGKLADDATFICKWLGCHGRSWTAIKRRLIEAGKIAVEGGYITNERCSKEFENSLKIIRNRTENALKGSEVRRQNKELAEANGKTTTTTTTTTLKKERTSNEVPKKENASPSAQPIATGGPQTAHANLAEARKPQTGVPHSPRGCRIPDDWQPTSDDREYAASQGCTSVETERIALDFSQYWRAKAGKDAVKRDWHATWQRWVRTDRDGTFKRSNGNGNGEENIREWLINQAIKGPFGPMVVHVDGTCSNSTQRDLDFTQGEGFPLLRGPGKSH